MNKFGNISKMVAISDPAWVAAKETGLAGLAVKHEMAPYVSGDGRQFINMCSCSYLGLDTNESILQGAIHGIEKAGTLHLTTARTRLVISLLSDLEDALSEHYGGEAVSYISCAAATSAFLPMFASGIFSGGRKPVMAFDKYAHFSMNHVKPICGDETQVETCPHNDLNFVEDLCKRHEIVAYIGDGTYSVEGFAPVEQLKYLQDRYGLFLYLDDSHGLSITGERGEGHVLRNLGELNDRTIVVGSLAKAFGACGGLLVSGNPSIKERLVRYGNPWSQYMNSAGIGGTFASLALHKSPELARLQAAWRRNLSRLDEQFESINRFTESPVRVILLDSAETAVGSATALLARGFYTSAVFFPIVPKDTAGLRIMPRADLTPEQMNAFCTSLMDVCGAALRSTDIEPATAQ
ncbi:aminotransferase class I/II-fold pyridoxal phosphate-dependent enzyme [Rhizobacter sp. P5_C2]